MKKHWLYYITPCILVSAIAFIIAVVGLANIDEGEGWGIVYLFMFFPALVIFMTIDWLIKKITKGNILRIWVIELLVVIVVFIWLRNL